ncbi:MAG: hypothetical protein ACOVSW_10270 [Candidatus Kapaibacteriota bacterium]
MTVTLYDLNYQQRTLVLALYEKAKASFPEVDTHFDISLDPDNKEHILVDVAVPFYDNERELEFSHFLAEIESDSHLATGMHISFMPHYVPALNGTHSYEPA